MLFKVTISKQSWELSSRELSRVLLDLNRRLGFFTERGGFFFSIGFHLKHVGRRKNTSCFTKSAWKRRIRETSSCGSRWRWIFRRWNGVWRRSGVYYLSLLPRKNSDSHELQIGKIHVLDISLSLYISVSTHSIDVSFKLSFPRRWLTVVWSENSFARGRYKYNCLQILMFSKQLYHVEFFHPRVWQKPMNFFHLYQSEIFKLIRSDRICRADFNRRPGREEFLIKSQVN